MKVSLNWIKNFAAVDIAADELVEKIGAQLGAVEEVIDTSGKYKGIIIVKVVSCRKHPNADKLRVCLVDDGGAVKKVKRDKQGLIEIVCGAPNVKAGMLAAWIPPGNTVPSTYDKEPFILEAREIRGVVSNGMLASAQELDIGDDHTGIVEIDKVVKPGSDFAVTYNMNDFVIDIENKMFTHRPDLFGHLGIAREIAGILQRQFKSPDWYKEEISQLNDGRGNVLKLSVENKLPKLVPRFCAVVVKDIKVEPSPLWLRAALSRVGVRPVNNVVDLTNFYMLVTAQPLHAYDLDKVGTGVLGVRQSKKGEKLRLIGGKEIVLETGATLITDGQRPIGLGGVMGGADTEVDDGTKNIILECASFDMNTTRRTAMHYGLFTDAATRFTKNQSPRQNMAVMTKALADIKQIAGGRVASRIIDDSHLKPEIEKLKVTASFINSRLGIEISAGEMKSMLENVEFDVDSNGEILIIEAPFWRTDISIPEDIVEEIGRLYGYDKLPIVLPNRDLTPAQKDNLLELKQRLRNILRRAGANEVLTYSFVHGRLMQTVGQDPKDAYHIRNAVSPELQYYRLSVTPSILDKIHPNIKAGFNDFALFELGKGHNQKMKDKDGLPLEFEMLSLVLASKSKSPVKNGAAYYQVRRMLDYLAAELGMRIRYQAIKEQEPYPAAKPFDQTRSAQVWVGKTPLGMVGEFTPKLIKDLKLPSYCAGFEIGISQLSEVIPEHRAYQPINRYPLLEQAFNLRSSSEIPFAELNDFMLDQLEKLSRQHGYGFRIDPLDIFQKPGDKKHKQTTWRIILWHPERTLTTLETNKLLDELAATAKKQLKAERI